MSDSTRQSSTAPPPEWKAHGTSGHAIYEELAATDEFRELRHRFRAFVLPYTLAFLAWYLLFVVMSNWADGFMDTKLVGHINVALVFGLLQFVSTFTIAVLYSRFASRRLDPLATTLRDRYDAEVHR